TQKLDLPKLAASDPVVAEAELPCATRLIDAACQLGLSIAPVVLLPAMVAVADAFVIVVETKLASGSTPWFDDGASTTHSAEERLAPARVCTVLNDCVV